MRKTRVVTALALTRESAPSSYLSLIIIIHRAGDHNLFASLARGAYEYAISFYLRSGITIYRQVQHRFIWSKTTEKL